MSADGGWEKNQDRVASGANELPLASAHWNLSCILRYFMANPHD